MTMPHDEPHAEIHKSQRSTWLRAAVLGVNDGIVSTSSLMLGVIAANADRGAILTAGIAGLVAGAASMAVGEYVSVSSQKDSERADIEIERRSLAENAEAEEEELAQIYVERGVELKLARQVARQLHAKDPVIAHVRDELGIDIHELSNPLQAAVASAASFTLGAAIPVLAALAAHGHAGSIAIVVSSLVMLAVSGAVGAIVGGGNRFLAAARVFVGGGVAMAVTAAIGTLVGRSL